MKIGQHIILAHTLLLTGGVKNIDPKVIFSGGIDEKPEI